MTYHLEILKEGQTAIFTDGAKTEKGTGAGIYCEQLQVEESYKLQDTCSVLQAEILAIEKAATLSNVEGTQAKVCIYTDSQAALKTLASRLTRSKAVMSCREALSWIRNSEVRLCRVPGHSDVEGNNKADKLAKLGAEKENIAACELPKPTIKVIRIAVDNAIKEMHSKR